MQVQQGTDAKEWSVAIFAARESCAELTATLMAVMAALSRPARVDVLVNGNDALASQCAESFSVLLKVSTRASIRLWSIALGDKAHAWNEYVYKIWSPAAFTFFLDGYVRPDRDALELLEGALTCTHGALGATGVPRTGTSAKKLRMQMIQQGGLHGNLHCLTRQTIERLIDSGFRLPLGIYRTDATLGAALMFDVDPAHNEWEPERICVEPRASWMTRTKKWWRWTDLKAQLKRSVRQAQGILENRAVRELFAVQRLPVSSLPVTADQLVANWIDACPQEAKAQFWRAPLSIYALRMLKRKRDWAAANDPPSLLRELR